MQALVFENGVLQLQRAYPNPVPAQGEVLIDVETAGVCSTDLEIAKGYQGFEGVPGHEFVGRVSKGPRDLLGKRVVGEINCVCGACDMCQSGLSNHCRRRTVLGISGRDGAFAQQLTLPARNVHVLPESIGNDQAVFVEPVAAALQIARQVNIEKRDRVIVVGDGRLGLLAVQVLAQVADRSKLTLLGRHADKLLFCEKRGLQARHVDEMLIKPEWDVVVDCAGGAEGFATACRLVRPRGRLVLKSTWVADRPVDLSPLVVNEVTLIGSRCGPFAEAIRALAAEQVVVNGLITSRFSLEDGVEACRRAAEPEQVKVLIDVAR